jgi:hypothetical protein
MFDELFNFRSDMEDEHLTYGMILEGSQKPSEVLESHAALPRMGRAQAHGLG